METTHRPLTADARSLGGIEDGSIQLVATSPPYPMIQMWDELFASLSPEVAPALEREDGLLAFELMHRELDKCWDELYRVVSSGGFVCINIGDATRTIGGEFRLYHNHARIIQKMAKCGFTVLPDILWRKPTNAPNKFMGSGTLPAGAYVTYEHEYILVFRKGGKRSFSPAEKENRRRSAFFWEERNVWFSDVWEGVRGTRQKVKAGRERSAAFPLEIPLRLILMYSCYGDTVLDPFVGTGTTMLASLAVGRSSIGVDIDPEFAGGILSMLAEEGKKTSHRIQQERINAHWVWLTEQDPKPKHVCIPHLFGVKTRQEKELELLRVASLTRDGERVRASYRRN